MKPCNLKDIWGIDGPLDARKGLADTRAMLEQGYGLSPHAEEFLRAALDDAEAIRRLLERREAA